MTLYCTSLPFYQQSCSAYKMCYMFKFSGIAKNKFSTYKLFYLLLFNFIRWCACTGELDLQAYVFIMKLCSNIYGKLTFIQCKLTFYVYSFWARASAFSARKIENSLWLFYDVTKPKLYQKIRIIFVSLYTVKKPSVAQEHNMWTLRNSANHVGRAAQSMY
jgi:hypothetical protein